MSQPTNGAAGIRYDDAQLTSKPIIPPPPPQEEPGLISKLFNYTPQEQQNIQNWKDVTVPSAPTTVGDIMKAGGVPLPIINALNVKPIPGLDTTAVIGNQQPAGLKPGQINPEYGQIYNPDHLRWFIEHNSATLQPSPQGGYDAVPIWDKYNSPDNNSPMQQTGHITGSIPFMHINPNGDSYPVTPYKTVYTPQSIGPIATLLPSHIPMTPDEILTASYENNQEVMQNKNLAVQTAVNNLFGLDNASEWVGKNLFGEPQGNVDINNAYQYPANSSQQTGRSIADFINGATSALTMGGAVASFVPSAIGAGAITGAALATPQTISDINTGTPPAAAITNAALNTAAMAAVSGISPIIHGSVLKSIANGASPIVATAKSVIGNLAVGTTVFGTTSVLEDQIANIAQNNPGMDFSKYIEMAGQLVGQQIVMTALTGGGYSNYKAASDIINKSVIPTVIKNPNLSKEAITMALNKVSPDLPLNIKEEIADNLVQLEPNLQKINPQSAPPPYLDLAKEGATFNIILNDNLENRNTLKKLPPGTFSLSPDDKPVPNFDVLVAATIAATGNESLLKSIQANDPQAIKAVVDLTVAAIKNNPMKLAYDGMPNNDLMVKGEATPGQQLLAKIECVNKFFDTFNAMKEQYPNRTEFENLQEFAKAEEINGKTFNDIKNAYVNKIYGKNPEFVISQVDKDTKGIKPKRKKKIPPPVKTEPADVPVTTMPSSDIDESNISDINFKKQEPDKNIWNRGFNPETGELQGGQFVVNPDDKSINFLWDKANKDPFVNIRAFADGANEILKDPVYANDHALIAGAWEAEQLIKLHDAGRINFKISKTPDGNPAIKTTGKTSFAEGEKPGYNVTLMFDDKNLPYRTAAHELMHALTAWHEYVYPDDPVWRQIGNMRQALLESERHNMENSDVHIDKGGYFVNEHGGAHELYYGLSNNQEFVAELMSNEKFAPLLAHTAYTDTPAVTFLDKAKNLIRKFFEAIGLINGDPIKPGSMLETALNSLIDRFEVPEDNKPCFLDPEYYNTNRSTYMGNQPYEEMVNPKLRNLPNLFSPHDTPNLRKNIETSAHIDKIRNDMIERGASDDEINRKIQSETDKLLYQSKKDTEKLGNGFFNLTTYGTFGNVVGNVGEKLKEGRGFTPEQATIKKGNKIALGENWADRIKNAYHQGHGDVEILYTTPITKLIKETEKQIPANERRILMSLNHIIFYETNGMELKAREDPANKKTYMAQKVQLTSPEHIKATLRELSKNPNMFAIAGKPKLTEPMINHLVDEQLPIFRNMVDHINDFNHDAHLSKYTIAMPNQFEKMEQDCDDIIEQHDADELQYRTRIAALKTQILDEAKAKYKGRTNITQAEKQSIIKDTKTKLDIAIKTDKKLETLKRKTHTPAYKRAKNKKKALKQIQGADGFKAKSKENYYIEGASNYNKPYGVKITEFDYDPDTGIFSPKRNSEACNAFNKTNSKADAIENWYTTAGEFKPKGEMVTKYHAKVMLGYPGMFEMDKFDHWNNPMLNPDGSPQRGYFRTTVYNMAHNIQPFMTLAQCQAKLYELAPQGLTKLPDILNALEKCKSDLNSNGHSMDDGDTPPTDAVDNAIEEVHKINTANLDQSHAYEALLSVIQNMTRKSFPSRPNNGYRWDIPTTKQQVDAHYNHITKEAVSRAATNMGSVLPMAQIVKELDHRLYMGMTDKTYDALRDYYDRATLPMQFDIPGFSPEANAFMRLIGKAAQTYLLFNALFINIPSALFSHTLAAISNISATAAPGNLPGFIKYMGKVAINGALEGIKPNSNYGDFMFGKINPNMPWETAQKIQLTNDIGKRILDSKFSLMQPFTETGVFNKTMEVGLSPYTAVIYDLKNATALNAVKGLMGMQPYELSDMSRTDYINHLAAQAQGIADKGNGLFVSMDNGKLENAMKKLPIISSAFTILSPWVHSLYLANNDISTSISTHSNGTQRIQAMQHIFAAGLTSAILLGWKGIKFLNDMYSIGNWVYEKLEKADEDKISVRPSWERNAQMFLRDQARKLGWSPKVVDKIQDFFVGGLPTLIGCGGSHEDSMVSAINLPIVSSVKHLATATAGLAKWDEKAFLNFGKAITPISIANIIKACYEIGTQKFLDGNWKPTDRPYSGTDFIYQILFREPFRTREARNAKWVKGQMVDDQQKSQGLKGLLSLGNIEIQDGLNIPKSASALRIANSKLFNAAPLIYDDMYREYRSNVSQTALNVSTHMLNDYLKSIGKGLTNLVYGQKDLLENLAGDDKTGEFEKTMKNKIDQFLLIKATSAAFNKHLPEYINYSNKFGNAKSKEIPNFTINDNLDDIQVITDPSNPNNKISLGSLPPDEQPFYYAITPIAKKEKLLEQTEQ